MTLGFLLSCNLSGGLLGHVEDLCKMCLLGLYAEQEHDLLQSQEYVDELLCEDDLQHGVVMAGVIITGVRAL